MESSAELQVKIGILEKEQEHQQKYVDKIDIAIQKLEEISANTVKIIALHEQKLDLQTQTDDNLQNQVDQIKTEFTNHEKNTSNAFTGINLKLDNFETKIDSMAGEVNELKTKTEKTVSTLERYFWLFSTVGSITYFIISNFDKIKIFFQ